MEKGKKKKVGPGVDMGAGSQQDEWMRTKMAVVGGLVLVLAMAQGLSGQVHNGVELVRARLVADSETVAPGYPVTLGLYLQMAPGWHTYWEYPGDAGMATGLELRMPEGFRSTAIQWPLPQRLVEPGDMEVYAYKDEVLLLVRVFPPAELDASEVVIEGLATWLVCEAVCLPGQETLTLTLPVGEVVRPANAELFERFRGQLPQPIPGPGEGPVQVSWERRGQELLLNVGGEAETYAFYPLPPSGVVLGHPETREEGVIRVLLKSAPADLDRLPGVLVAEDAAGERRGWRLTGR